MKYMQYIYMQYFHYYYSHDYYHNCYYYFQKIILLFTITLAVIVFYNFYSSIYYNITVTKFFCQHFQSDNVFHS